MSRWFIFLLLGLLHFDLDLARAEGSNGSTTVELACGDSITVDTDGASGADNNPPSATSSATSQYEAIINCVPALFQAAAAAQVSCEACEGEGCELELAGTPPSPTDPNISSNVAIGCVQSGELVGQLVDLALALASAGALDTDFGNKWQCYCYFKKTAPTFTYDVQCSACITAQKCDPLHRNESLVPVW